MLEQARRLDLTPAVSEAQAEEKVRIAADLRARAEQLFAPEYDDEDAEAGDETPAWIEAAMTLEPA